MKGKIFMALAALLLLVFCMLPLQGCFVEDSVYGDGPGYGYGYGYGYPAYSSYDSWYGPRYVYHPWFDHDDWREHHWGWFHDHDDWREHHWGHRWGHDRDDWARGGGWHHRG